MLENRNTAYTNRGAIMKTSFSRLLLLSLLFYLPEVIAHPGSGIVADRQGNIYFVDTGSGVWKIDRAGKLSRLPGPAYHWMAIDLDGRLANATLPYFSEGDAMVVRVGSNPTLLLSSDYPLAAGPDGSIYYPWHQSGDNVKIFRLSPSGTSSVVTTLPPLRSQTSVIRWRNGITVSADGSVYYTEDKAVRMVTPGGVLKTVIDNFHHTGCGTVAGLDAEFGPHYRGLAVDSTGNVYVAATGCRSVVKITPDKKVTTVLQASYPWSPTGVTVSGTDLFVLEYLHTAGENRVEWIPRVRKISSDGTVTTVAAIDRR